MYRFSFTTAASRKIPLIGFQEAATGAVLKGALKNQKI